MPRDRSRGEKRWRPRFVRCGSDRPDRLVLLAWEREGGCAWARGGRAALLAGRHWGGEWRKKALWRKRAKLQGYQPGAACCRAAGLDSVGWKGGTIISPRRTAGSRAGSWSSRGEPNFT